MGLESVYIGGSMHTNADHVIVACLSFDRSPSASFFLCSQI